MATYPKKKRYTAQERQDYLEQFGRSGQSQAEFCRRQMLHPVTFSHWWRTMKSVATGFAEVQASAPPLAPISGAAVLHLAGGVKLEFALGDEAAWAGLGLMLKTLHR
jgi:transposase-like protein